MNKLRFYFSAIRNNVRTAPLAVIAMAIAISAAFVGEAWIMRMDYNTLYAVDSETVMFMWIYSIPVCGILFLYLMFMYRYWLRITTERNLPYERMGAPRYVLVFESAVELILILFVSYGLGCAFDSLLNYIAPRLECVRYIDGYLFAKSAVVTAVAPIAVWLFCLKFDAIKRCVKRVRNRIGSSS